MPNFYTMKIVNLINQIQIIDNGFKSEANKAVNQLLTIRNWLIGYYIVVYEQDGVDRAQYGKKLLQTLSEKLNRKGLSARNLRLFRQFYFSFPKIWQLLTAKSPEQALPILKSVILTFSDNKIGAKNQGSTNWQLPTAKSSVSSQKVSNNIEFSDEQIVLTTKMI